MGICYLGLATGTPVSEPDPPDSPSWPSPVWTRASITDALHTEGLYCVEHVPPALVDLSRWGPQVCLLYISVYIQSIFSLCSV